MSELLPDLLGELMPAALETVVGVLPELKADDKNRSSAPPEVVT